MKPLPPELEAKIEEVKLWMFPGDQDEVARRAKAERSRVSAVLNKRVTPRKDILAKAIEVMNENKSRFEIAIQENKTSSYAHHRTARNPR